MARQARGAPLRVGILCEGSSLAAWQIACLREVLRLDFVQISLLICNRSKAPETGPGLLARLQALRKTSLFSWRSYERLVLNRRLTSTSQHPFPPELADVPRLDCEPLKLGRYRETFDPETLAAIAEHDLDVVLRFGFGILTGEALNIARFGIWSHHHGDPEQFRGAPPGFWEIHEGAPVTGAILQRLTEKLDGGVVLDRAYFRTMAGNYARSLDRLLFGSAPMVARALTILWQDQEAFARLEPARAAGPIFRYPRNLAVLRFLWRSWEAWLGDQFRALFRSQQWTLGLIPLSQWQVVEQATGHDLIVKDVNWLPEPKGSFLADPFLLGGEERTIVAEQYDWSSGVGHLSRVSVQDRGQAIVEPVLERSEHLSYPFVFEHDGRTLCMPECSEAGAVLLYEIGAGGKMVALGEVISGFKAVDPTLVRHDGLYWLFCTQAGAHDNEALYAFFAPALEGPWTPHALNPIKIDVRSARPAGPILVRDGELIRPAQDCSERYGGAIMFHRITKLSPECFEEEGLGRLVPDPKGRYPHGLHTISGANGLTVIDGARRTFVPRHALRLLREKLGLRKS